MALLNLVYRENLTSVSILSTALSRIFLQPPGARGGHILIWSAFSI